jgi:hypothetical protein
MEFVWKQAFAPGLFVSEEAPASGRDRAVGGRAGMDMNNVRRAPDLSVFESDAREYRCGHHGGLRRALVVDCTRAIVRERDAISRTNAGAIAAIADKFTQSVS